MEDFTQLAEKSARGDVEAREKLLDAVHAELRQVALREFRREQPSHTLQVTALVNEAYLRLFGAHPVSIASRQHFWNLAARTMRRVLVDYARAKQAAKRPSRDQRVELQEDHSFSAEDPETILSIHQALEKLSLMDPRLVEIVELRFFAGMNVEETAATMGVSETTVKREFAVARAFLEKELRAAQE